MGEGVEELLVRVSKEHWTDDRTCVRRPCAIEEWFRPNGSRHRPNGLPAITVRDVETSEIIREEYWEHGQRHRWDKPAIVHKGDEEERLEWHVRGQRHRDSEPSILETHVATGIVLQESWHRHGKLFRPGGGLANFCRVYDDELDMITEEIWLDDQGRFHNEDGPAELVRDTLDGIVTLERWCLHGEPHRNRADGAALIQRNLFGQIKRSEFFENGQPVSETQPLIVPSL